MLARPVFRTPGPDGADHGRNPAGIDRIVLDEPHVQTAGLARHHIAQPYLQRYELVRLPGPALKARFAYYAVHPAHKPPSAAAHAGATRPARPRATG